MKIIALLLVLAMLVAMGCISTPNQAGDSIVKNTTIAGNQNQNNTVNNQSEQSGDTSIDTTQTDENETGQTSTPQENTTVTPVVPAKNSTLLLLGRSVAYGWATYMNLEWQEDESYLGTYQGKKIRYYQLSTPPDIADSAITAISTYDSDIVFFKLCFADFNGEQDNLVENKRYVEEIYSEVVTKKHKKLIIGNALPQIAQDTTSEIKQEHQAYNSWLSNFAATHQHVQVIDLYGMLSNSNGALKPEYAVGDSHLNDNAYAKITPALIQAINNAQ